MTPLHIAVDKTNCSNQLEIIEFLLQKGASITITDNEGRMPIGMLGNMELGL